MSNNRKIVGVLWRFAVHRILWSAAGVSVILAFFGDPARRVGFAVAFAIAAWFFGPPWHRRDEAGSDPTPDLPESD
jgi:hypothetical protein